MSDAIKGMLSRPYIRQAVLDTDGSYFAQIVEFPGCFATGDTKAEALARLEDVAESWIMAALSQGQTIPSPSEE
jgi:predicted RNase H-like HicB family nuclease